LLVNSTVLDDCPRRLRAAGTKRPGGRQR
jgi:hypothetical protein